MSDYIELYKKLELLMKENKENKLEVLRLTEQLEFMEQQQQNSFLVPMNSLMP